MNSAAAIAAPREPELADEWGQTNGNTKFGCPHSAASSASVFRTLGSRSVSSSLRLSLSLSLPVLLLVLLTACSPSKTPEPPKPAAPTAAPVATNAPPAAQALFDRTTKEFHLPSAEASGARRKELLAQAAAGYEQLLREHPTHTNLCAQALRSLANIRATEGRLDEAIALHASVAQRFSAEEWEVLQAWKSAGDLLADAQRAAEAAPFYRQIIERFDRTNAAPVVQIIVRSARKRLAAPRRPGARPIRAPGI